MDIIAAIVIAYVVVHLIHAWEQWYYPWSGERSYWLARRRRERMEARETLRRRSLGYLA